MIPRQARPLVDYRRLLDALPDAVLVGDDHGRIIYANPSAQALLGYSVPRLEGMRIEDLAPTQLRNRQVAGYRGYFLAPEKGFQRSVYVVPAVCADGTRMSVEITLNAAASAEGEPLVVASIRSVEELAEMRRRTPTSAAADT